MKSVCVFFAFLAIYQVGNAQVIDKVKAIQDDSYDLYLKLTAIPLDTMHQVAKMSDKAVTEILEDIEEYFSNPNTLRELRERESSIPAFQVDPKSNGVSFKVLHTPPENVVKDVAKTCIKQLGLDKSSLAGRSLSKTEIRQVFFSKVNLVCILKQLEKKVKA